MIVEDVLKTLAADLKTFVQTETIFGDPIEIQGTTMIPICKMSMGYGGGGGEGEGSDEKRGGGKGTGGGAGAGLKIEPAALVIIKNGEVSVVSVAQTSKWEEVLEQIPDVISKIAQSVGDKADESKSLSGDHENK